MLILDMFVILSDSQEWIHSIAARVLYLLLPFLLFAYSVGTLGLKGYSIDA